MHKLSIVAAALLSATALPATAAPLFNAFDSFDGTQGAENFYYGQGTPTSFNYFPTATDCFITGSTCLQQTNDHNVPGVTKSTSTSFQYGTVNVPDNRLLLHPSSDVASSVYALFRAPTTGQYNIRGTFNVQDIAPTGVGVSFFTGFGGNSVLTPINLINAANPSAAFGTSVFLSQGDQVGFAFNNAGSYFNDSTGFNFLASTGAVPEPTTWAMMLAGFGMIGFAARRRSSIKTTVRFA